MKEDSVPEKQEASKLPAQAIFRNIAEKTSRRLGSPIAFFSALILILLWATSGFYLGFNETWQLIINTGTTIATFLMVILVQNTQYREARSTQLKLDEILRGTKNTRDFFVDVEEESDAELDRLKEQFKEVREKYLARVQNRKNKPKGSNS